jgi:hypothetical protein
MSFPFKNYKTVASGSHLLGVCLLALLVVALPSCNKHQKQASENGTDSIGGKVTPKTFASPAAAGDALFGAAKANDQSALVAIFGSDGKDLLSSGDPVKDKNNLQGFVDAYNRMHRWSKSKAGGEILYIGADNFPFPIPLDQNASGQWVFNTLAGKDEILARRIGDSELTAIGVLTEIANAQQEYFSQTHQFAQKFVSDPGQRNGLYWQVSNGQRPSPLGALGDVAKSLGYSSTSQNFNGYVYKILTQQGPEAKGGAKNYLADGKLTGGFAVVAWPAKYKDSGIMTFMVNKDGVIYQKDLGEKTNALAADLAAYNPVKGWTVVLAPESANPSPGPRSTVVARQPEQ